MPRQSVVHGLCRPGHGRSGGPLRRTEPAATAVPGRAGVHGTRAGIHNRAEQPVRPFTHTEVWPEAARSLLMHETQGAGRARWPAVCSDSAAHDIGGRPARRTPQTQRRCGAEPRVPPPQLPPRKLPPISGSAAGCDRKHCTPALGPGCSSSADVSFSAPWAP